ncbi:MAG: type 4a pilus biogenesis protein PilO [Actinomycetota bacterium]|nr:type 4a pilus biogenesis protein PilO [Actinomycetota bacterium]
MKLTTQQKLIIAILLIVLVAVAAVFLLIVPQFGALGDLDDQIAQAQQDQKDASLLLETRKEKKLRASETDVKLMRLANELPETPELPAMIIELQDVVNESGLEFASLTPGEPTQRPSDAAAEPEYWAIPVSLTVRGTWQDTVDVIQRLRRLTRQMRIVNFSTSRYEPDTDLLPSRTFVETSIQLEAYSLATKQEGPDKTVPPAPGQ